MANLVSISAIDSPSGRGQNAIATILTKSNLLRFLDQQGGFELDATSYNYRPIVAGSSLKKRAAGSAYSSTALTPGAAQTGALALMGDSVTIDVTYKRDAERGLRDINNWLQGELTERLIEYGPALEIELMKGTGSSNAMKGLSVLLNGTDDIPGFTGTTGVINGKDFVSSGNSFDLSGLTAAQFQKAKEMLMAALDQVDNPTGIICNRSLANRLTTVADYFKIGGTTLDEFGMRVKTFDGVPLVVVSDSAILNTEPDDAGTPVNNTTSLYVVSPAEKQFSVVTNSGIAYQDYDSPDNDQKDKEWWEFAAQWKVQTKNSVRRLRNIKL